MVTDYKYHGIFPMFRTKSYVTKHALILVCIIIYCDILHTTYNVLHTTLYCIISKLLYLNISLTFNCNYYTRILAEHFASFVKGFVRKVRL